MLPEMQENREPSAIYKHFVWYVSERTQTYKQCKTQFVYQDVSWSDGYYYQQLGPRRRAMKGEPPQDPSKIKRTDQFKIIPRKNTWIRIPFKNHTMRYSFRRAFQEKTVLGQDVY